MTKASPTKATDCNCACHDSQRNAISEVLAENERLRELLRQWLEREAGSPKTSTPEPIADPTTLEQPSPLMQVPSNLSYRTVAPVFDAPSSLAVQTSMVLTNAFTEEGAQRRITNPRMSGNERRSIVEQMRRNLANMVFYCDTCERDALRCPKCGNNDCNGGYGEINGEKCDLCPAVYDLSEFADRNW